MLMTKSCRFCTELIAVITGSEPDQVSQKLQQKTDFCNALTLKQSRSSSINFRKC